MVGAGVIAAVANALEPAAVSFRLRRRRRELRRFARRRAAAAAGARGDGGLRACGIRLELRVAMIPVDDIRSAGRDVRVARFGASAALRLCDVRRRRLMWFEQEAKRGRIRSAGRAGRARGSDRSFLPLGRRAGEARRHAVGDRRAARRRSQLRGAGQRGRRNGARRPQSERPVTVDSLRSCGRGRRIALEAAALKALGGCGAKARLNAAANYLLGVTFHAFRLKAGGFDAAVYAGDVAANADFRKFDEGCA